MKSIFEEEQDLMSCNISLVLPILNSKWVMPIIYYLCFGKLRYSELKKKLPPMADSNYSKVLNNMESFGLIERKDYHEMPPRVEYSLSEIGKRIIPIMKEIEQFGKYYVATIEIEEDVK